MSSASLRDQLIRVALEWEQTFGVAPHITAAVSEQDAAQLVGCPMPVYCELMQTRTAVGKGYDFIFENKRYQVKANRPSGKPGSTVTLVAKARNYDWDFLIWILYNRCYQIEEAWLWGVESYKLEMDYKKRISPVDMRFGKRLA